ncbi:M20 aminoacylase family protein [Albimonas pacifica]|uniref:Hippurate hydrolase n=1 Tax=Albimonas pacifica TaxID=1114924 RepID=A0A1I3D0M5_9RHOB|nr:M20 aminoacylase family protein [Albimonas pacifica]SFH80178.1 hippurate hydrolase [Albimonas pacifica]
MPLPVPNAIAALLPELTAWRRDLHAHPEVGFDLPRTAGLVAAKLRAFGLDEVVEGLGRSGVVGLIHGQDGPAADAVGRILLRADMDALPMQEATGLPHASTVPGAFHGCGHDGHTVMLLGAARRLAETRNFSGTAVLVFQPAEEGDRGAKAMIDDGLLDRWPVRAAFGLHNAPGMALGAMGTRPGPMLAYSDRFRFTLRGRGGHAARPHLADDPIVAAASLVQGLQALVARRRDPMVPALISVTRLEAGTASNVIPQTAELWGTLRTLDPDLVAPMIEGMRQVAERTAAAHGVALEAELGLDADPALVNDPAATAFATQVMREVAGEDAVDPAVPAEMGGEDFAWFAQAVPACFALIGNGASAPVHHPEYDFDDAAAPHGVAWWCRLVERALPRRA